jgi:MFS family permease
VPGSTRGDEQGEASEERPDAGRTPLLQRIGRVPGADGLKRAARVRAKQAIRGHVPGRARAAFRIDMTAMFLAGLYTGAVFPFVSVIARDDLHASTQILALMAAAPFFGNLMALFWAQAMEGRRKTPFVKWSHLSARFTILLSLFAGGAWPFALVISGAQIIGTVATPAYAAIIKDIYPEEQRGRIVSLTRAAILVAQVASTLFAGWLMTHLGKGSYRVVFPAAALVGMAAALVFSRINPEEGASEPETPETLDEENGAAAAPLPLGQKLKDTARFVWSTLGILGEDRTFRWFALSVFTYGFGNLLTVPIIPLIQVDELHITKGQVAILFNLMQVVAIGSYFYWGRFVDRHGPQRAVVLNVMLNTCVPAVYILTGGVPHATAWVLLPAYLVSGVVNAGIDISYFSAILTFSGPENVSRYQALQSFLLGIRGTAAPYIGVALVALLQAHHLNLRWAFVVGITFMLTGAWMQFVAMRRQEAERLVRDQG